jgi:RNA polymerase sigma-54 factor
MKQSLQLRLGQQLTMTPQLQQAIRLLQLSVLDLREEMQEAIESNPMLELEEHDNSELLQGLEAHSQSPQPLEQAAEFQASDTDEGLSSLDAELRIDREEMPDDLPVDTDWDAVYEGPAGHQRNNDDDDHDLLTQRSAGTSLHDHLLWQLNLSHFSANERLIGEAIIDSIDEDGYLKADLEDIRKGLHNGQTEVSIEEMHTILYRVQAFDPPGVAARSPQECLDIQLRQLPEDTPMRAAALALVRQHFELLVAQERTQIQRRLKLSSEELLAVMQLIRSLSPRPGSQIATSTPQYIIPDVLVTRHQGHWQVELNPEAVPRLRINNDYANLVKRADQSDDNNFLRNHLQEARWLLKSLQSRNETLLRVATSIVRFQRAFLDHGEEAMKPLVLRDVAEELEMHESTISRVTTQKFMHTPRGTFEFKYFFSSHVSTSAGGECSATAIRALIKKLVAAENPKKPLSDHKLAGILEEQGLQVARRTVAKYRESLAIPPSNERKRLI